MSSPSDLLERIRAVVRPAVHGAGLHLEDLSVANAGRRTVVRVVVDLPDGPGGVHSDQLGEVSRAISAALDETDPIAGQYTLEVTTPGVDRPLGEPRHYRRNIGRLLSVTTPGGAALTGRLREAGEDELVLEVDGVPQIFAYSDVATARVEVEFKKEG